jgi:hypothetical protein
MNDTMSSYFVNRMGAIGASVQCRPNQARFLLYRFDEVNPVIDQHLLLLRCRLKDVDQRDQMALSGNEHTFPPLSYHEP